MRCFFARANFDSAELRFDPEAVAVVFLRRRRFVGFGGASGSDSECEE